MGTEKQISGIETRLRCRILGQMESSPVQRREHSLQKDLHRLAEKESDRLTTSSRQGPVQPRPDDFQTVLKISSSFRDCGPPPTTFGKALHFFLPETVMMWDQTIVRNTYKLRPDPESFVSYQRFGWKLLHHVTRDKTVNVLRQLENDHSRSIDYFEPNDHDPRSVAYYLIGGRGSRSRSGA